MAPTPARRVAAIDPMEAAPPTRRSQPAQEPPEQTEGTCWWPCFGRWKWLRWPAAGKLPLVHAGGREVCGLVGGPGGVPEPYQNPTSCTWITIRLLRARPGGIAQPALMGKYSWSQDIAVVPGSRPATVVLHVVRGIS